MPSGINYTRCVVIVHGKSELMLVKYIYTNLHLPVKIISKDKGRGSIQINDLIDFLKMKPFRSLQAFSDEYLVEYDKKNKQLLNLKIFIIMDTYDCDELLKKQYVSGELFQGHLLKDYIIPIYNENNLEDVMLKSKIMFERIDSSEKGKYYSKIFPINTEPLSIDTINQVRTFADRIRNVKQTNMLKFIDYCMEQLQQ